MQGLKETGRWQKSIPRATTLSVYINYRLQGKDSILHKQKHGDNSDFLFTLPPSLVCNSDRFLPFFHSHTPTHIILENLLMLARAITMPQE